MSMDFSTELYTFATLWSVPVIVAYFAMAFFYKLNMDKHKLHTALVVHNLICSMVNLYAAVVLLIGLVQVGSVFSMKKEEGLLRHGLQVFWLSKLYELIDTVFAVLRHSDTQINPMHVSYHSTIALLADWAYFVFPVAAVVPLQAMNSMIHVIMYGHYFLKLSKVYKFDKWGKQITQMHIVQFMIVISYGMFGYLYHGFSFFCILYGFGMFVILSNYYYHKFLSGSSKDSDGKKQN